MMRKRGRRDHEDADEQVNDDEKEGRRYDEESRSRDAKEKNDVEEN